MTQHWQAIWERRQPDPARLSTLAQLMALDGYDSFGTATDTSAWLAYTRYVAERLHIEPTDSIFEVGCGAGAFLYPFYQAGHPVGGLDYADNLVTIARQTMPGAALEVGEASALTVDEPYDVVVCQAAFLYFPSLDYAATVLRKMLAKARRHVGIFDVPDLATQAEALRYRRGALGEAEYARKYAGLDHLYFSRDWFAHILADEDVEVQVEDQRLGDYAHTPYRFNVFILRR